MAIRTYSALYSVYRGIDKYRKFYFVPVCAILVLLVIIRDCLAVLGMIEVKGKFFRWVYDRTITIIENRSRHLFALIRDPYRLYYGSLVPPYLYYNVQRPMPVYKKQEECERVPSEELLEDILRKLM